MIYSTSDTDNTTPIKKRFKLPKYRIAPGVACLTVPSFPEKSGDSDMATSFAPPNPKELPEPSFTT